MKGERLVARAHRRRPRTLLCFTVTLFVLKEDTVRQLIKGVDTDLRLTTCNIKFYRFTCLKKTSSNATVKRLKPVA